MERPQVTEPPLWPGPHDMASKDSPQLDVHTREIDLVNRDPKHLNQEMVEFEEVTAEPEGLHSALGVWHLTHTTFTVSQYWCYRVLTALCGVPAAILWGFLFACGIFWQVWAAVPCVRCHLLGLHCLARTFPVCLRAVCDPLSLAAGGVMHSLRLALGRAS
ncbi:caveolin-3-like [Leucoraja erinacea]|uniref:caveolin-3-like n=1 Tax=Leucoraja erinaceus TaxID=7782 RepID=UPI002453A273|nr:caveolin-3-like [Leucoraja erinacea]